jgi:uroporphyrinogen III methyltransferase / synthase
MPMSQPRPAQLEGARVLVTRPRRQAEDLCRQLAALGADVVVEPAIRISAPPDWSAVDAALDNLEAYDWLVFSSSNGVQFLLDRVRARHRSLDRLRRVKIAAVGPGTADELARYGLHAALVPDEFHAEALAAALVGRASGQRLLLARASRGRAVLAETLTSAGCRVDEIVVYTSSDAEPDDPEIRRLASRLAEGQIDWITVTSSAIARSLVRLFGEKLRRAKLASISPITSATLRECGYDPAVEAAESTVRGLVEAIRRSSGIPEGGPTQIDEEG